MLIAELYDALDDLEAQAISNAEVFAEDGDLVALEARLENLGQRAFDLATAVGNAVDALKSVIQ